MIQVNNEYFYEDLTYDSMQQLMKDWKEGKEPKVGPQNHRANSIGPQGRTSLYEVPEVAHSRDWTADKENYLKAKAEAAAKAAAAKAAAAAPK